MVLSWLNQGSAWSYHGITMVVPWYDHGEPWLDYGMTTMVELRYHSRFCRRTSILANLDKSPEVDEWISNSGSRTNNHLFTSTPHIRDLVIIALYKSTLYLTLPYSGNFPTLHLAVGGSEPPPSVHLVP